MTTILDRLRKIPDVDVPLTPAIEAGIADSVRYLGSDAALRSIDVDTYWPKWNSPWWHMLLLWELGEARQIPERAVRAMADGLSALPMHVFPINPEDTPPGCDPYRHSTCHCALGTMSQVLASCGIDVARALPWSTPWFARYQMADGGLNCDGDAYLQANECPSSMVATIPAIEAVLARDRGGEDDAFLERAGQFLIGRRLTAGSSTMFNAEERDVAPRWLALTFPRFYPYDVLRGLTALTRWVAATRRALPLDAISHVIEHLVSSFPDGVVRVQRQAFAKDPTRTQAADGSWVRAPASWFPLLEATSVLGAPSVVLTREWSRTRSRLLPLIDALR